MDSLEPYLDTFQDGFVTPTDPWHYGQLDESGEIAVKDDDLSRQGKFTRVLKVDFETGSVLFPLVQDPPTTGSPSWALKVSCDRLYHGIRSSMRIEVLSKTTGGFGSLCTLSPTKALTCDHVALVSGVYRCMEGGVVHEEGFSLPNKPRYHLKVLYRSKREDLALVETTQEYAFPSPANPSLVSLFEEYLLPCSPVDGGAVVIVSFPGITNFMFNARQELVDGTAVHGIWDTYEEVMDEEIEDAIIQIKAKPSSKMTETKIKQLAVVQVKRLLFRRLQETFGSHAGGSMTASVGRILGNTTTCSTLAGSSGGPVCPVDKPGYACALHRAGATRTNLCTTFDEPDFVTAYLEYVLGDLPEPWSQVWSGRDLGPFYKWLHKHCVNRSQSQQAWLQAAQAAVGTTEKRPAKRLKP